MTFRIEPSTFHQSAICPPFTIHLTSCFPAVKRFTRTLCHFIRASIYAPATWTAEAELALVMLLAFRQWLFSFYLFKLFRRFWRRTSVQIKPQRPVDSRRNYKFRVRLCQGWVPGCVHKCGLLSAMDRQCDSKQLREKALGKSFDGK